MASAGFGFIQNAPAAGYDYSRRSRPPAAAYFMHGMSAITNKKYQQAHTELKSTPAAPRTQMPVGVLIMVSCTPYSAGMLGKEFSAAGQAGARRANHCNMDAMN